jgi:hypothetical protein
MVTILTLLQLLVVVLGVLVTRALLNWSYLRWGNVPLPPFPIFMRDYGLWFALLPMVWATVAIFSIRTLDVAPTTGLLSRIVGLVLLALLFLAFGMSILVAISTVTYTGLQGLQ